MYDINNDHDSLISIRKNFNEYEIELTIKEDSCLNILIKNDLCCYENNFNENYLQQKFKLNESINNIYNKICYFIDKKEIQIEIFKTYLKLIFKNNNSYITLNIEISSKYLLEQINEINDKMKKKDILILVIIILFLLILFNIILFSSFIINNKNKINTIEEYNIKNINTRIETEKNKINDIIEKINLNDFNEKIDSILKKYDLLSYKFSKKNFTELKKITNGTEIYSLSHFSSGNIIKYLYCYSFQLLDKNLNNYQQLNYSPDDCMNGMYNNKSFNYIDTYKDSLFATCYNDGRIIIWKFNSNNYTYLNNEFDYDPVMKVIFTSNGDLISCSSNGNIIIWYLNNNNNTKNFILYHNNVVNSILLIEDKNILISSGNGIIFWNFKNKQILMSDENIYNEWNNGLEKLDDDRIIVCNNYNYNSLIIYSISKLEKIKEIYIDYNCYSIKSFPNKGIFLVGGNKNEEYNIIHYNIYVYLIGDYELLNTIEKAHNNKITGFDELYNNNIISYSLDKYINVWSFE